MKIAIWEESKTRLKVLTVDNQQSTKKNGHYNVNIKKLKIRFFNRICKVIPNRKHYLARVLPIAHDRPYFF
jgi:hypothetical protein